MWLVLGIYGMPARDKAARVFATRSHRRSRSLLLLRRWRTEASAPAATAGGKADENINPEAWLRMKSQIAVDAVM